VPETVQLAGISADFDGCEILVAAALSGDKGLYEAETSPFCWKCERDSVPGDECSCGYGDDGKLKAHTGLHWRTAHSAFGKAATKEDRYGSKRGVFTKWFGGTAETAAAQVYCHVRDMQKLFDAFDEDSPDFKAWDTWMRRCYKEGSVVWRDYATGQNFSQPLDGQNHMVYKAYSGRNIYISNGAHAAGNGAIQGTARELLVDGVLNWRKTRWGRLPIAPIHDEILTFVPAHEAHEAARVLVACMATDVLSSPGFEVHVGADVSEPFTSWIDSS
jgi:DNA polymerase I-like protein with 3'-5' exonuclease and polymerase domains